MLDWIRQNDTLLWWLGIASVVMFFGSLLIMPWLVAKLPADYFVRHKRPLSPIAQQHPVMRILVLIIRNLLGIILLIAGIAMLVLPGQGILTILVALMLLTFPGKYRLERWAVKQRGVMKSINWLRAKAHRGPMEMPVNGDGGEGELIE